MFLRALRVQTGNLVSGNHGKFIAGFNVQRSRRAGVEFQHKLRRAFAGISGARWRAAGLHVVVDGDQRAITVEEQNIQRQQGILHPKR